MQSQTELAKAQDTKREEREEGDGPKLPKLQELQKALNRSHLSEAHVERAIGHQKLMSSFKNKKRTT